MSISMAMPTTGRRDLFARLGAAVVGAGMLSVLKAQQANADCAPPGQCFGLPSCSCHGGGCPTTRSGGCCWAYSVTCATFVCCDNTCHDGHRGICLYKLCNCC